MILELLGLLTALIVILFPLIYILHTTGNLNLSSEKDDPLPWSSTKIFTKQANMIFI